jgi:hypothetical protein
MSKYSVSVDNGELSATHVCLDCDEFCKTKEGREFAEDGCYWPGSFRECEYARYPILEPA